MNSTPELLPMSFFQKMIVFICFVLNFNDGIDIMLVSFSGPEIISEWGLDKGQMGYIFSAALAGMTLGCFLVAPLADRLGRRKTIIISLVIESVGMLLIWQCKSFEQILALRFLTGLGVGGLLPTMAATVAEFSNEKFRDFNVGLVQAGWPVGAILTGFFCAWFIPEHGWRPAFFMAGLISVLMLVFVLFFMTDSEEFLLNKRPKNALKKLNFLRAKKNMPLLDALPAKSEINKKVTWRNLFSENYKSDTPKLWIAVFFGFMTLYTILSWVPTIAKEAGLNFEIASYVGVALNVGAAIGSASIGALGSKFGLRPMVLTFMVMAFSVMMLYANIPLTTILIFVLVFFIGVFVQGGFNGIWPVLARVYETEIRATGTGFAVGIGRFGAILGPTLYGWLADWGWEVKTLFMIFSIPLLLMGTAVWSLRSKRL